MGLGAVAARKSRAMSKTFTKLFSSLPESTVWCLPDSIRILWITMLAMADHAGRVFGSIPGLANRARISVEDAEKGLEMFMSPDRYSRTTDFEGRRIEVIDGGWRLLNYQRYREIRDDETIRESKRKWAEKNRQKLKSRKKVDKSRFESNSVDRDRANAEVDAEADVRNPCSFYSLWELYPRKVGKATAEKAWDRLGEKDKADALAVLPKHVKRWAVDGTDHKFIPYPSSWISGRRWLDVDPPPAPSMFDGVM